MKVTTFLRKYGFLLVILVVVSLPFFLLLDHKYAIDTGNLKISRHDEWKCINNYYDFLFQMTEIGRSDPRYYARFNGYNIYPSDPWEEVSMLPASLDTLNSGFGHGFSIELTGDNSDIWIRTNDKYLIVFKPEYESFSVVSPFPFDDKGYIYNDVYVKNIFETSNGMVIGINYPIDYETDWELAFPLFSIYDEINNQFEFYDVGLNFYTNDVRFNWEGMIPRQGVIIDSVDKLIWVYQQQIGLYSYDIDNKKLKHYELNSDQIIQSMVPSQEGKLLFRREKISGWELYPGELILYDPNSQTFEELDVPYPLWPDYGKLLYSDSGELWLGIHGFRSTEGEWELINPRRKAHINLGHYSTRFNWSHPQLVLQSSNGYLWYTNSSGDFLGVDGSAWYDPKSRKGCWFTTESGNIVEDKNNNLWMVIDRTIYKYSLNK